MKILALSILLFAGLPFEAPPEGAKNRVQEGALPAAWSDQLAPAGSIDPDDRERARLTLEKLAGGQKDGLRKLAKEGDEKAAIIAGLLGEKEVRLKLIGLLKSEDVMIRRAAAEAMSWCGGDSGLVDLGSKLDDADLPTAMAAARALARFKSKAGIALLQKALDGASKNERKALIAAHGLELADPGCMTTMIKTRLATPSLVDVVFAVSTNAPSVIEQVKRAIDKTFKRDESLKKVLETDDLAPLTRDALGTFCVRAAILNPADLLGYLKLPAGKATPWALDRIPTMRGMRKSYVACEIVKIIEGVAAVKSPSDADVKHVEALEAILQKFCGSKVPQGELADRAKEYREWYGRVWTNLVDADVYGAIDDGVAWLKRRQNKDGSWNWCACGFEAYANIPHYVGQTSLCGYTLLKMDVAHDDPAITKAVTYILDIEIAKTTDDPTYSLSIEIMFLAELVRAAKGKKQEKGTKVGLDPALQGRLLKRIQECVDWLIDARVMFEKGGYESAAWTYNNPKGVSYPKGTSPPHDHSNAQFAVLGLIAGQNVGAKVPLKVWQSVFSHWKGTQYEEGGWYYTPPAEGTAKNALVGSTSMTGAGLSSVLISHAALKAITTEKVAQTEEAAKRAIAKWTKTYPIAAPAKYGGSGHVFSIYYDYYSVERSMMLAGLLKIGDRDWYHDGALYILFNQMYDGAWIDTSDTCLALLFLKKAYIPVASGGSGTGDK